MIDFNPLWVCFTYNFIFKIISADSYQFFFIFNSFNLFTVLKFLFISNSINIFTILRKLKNFMPTNWTILFLILLAQQIFIIDWLLQHRFSSIFNVRDFSGGSTPGGCFFSFLNPSPCRLFENYILETPFSTKITKKQLKSIKH